MTEQDKKKGNVQSRYEELARDREPYLCRGRAAAALTKPYFLPRNNNEGGTDYPTPWQSVGPEGVSSFASKLGMILFPYQTTWFQYSITNAVDKNELAAMYGEDALVEIERNLSLREEAIRKYTETTELRTTGNEWWEHNIVAGNVLAYVPLDDKPMRSFSLNRYVVRRNNGNEVLELIIADALRPSTLPPEVLVFCQITPDLEKDEPLELYTWIKQDESGRWVAKQ